MIRAGQAKREKVSGMKWKSAEALGQATIIVSPSEKERNETARTFAAAALCLSPDEVPCGVCDACRKVRQGIHPDVITVSRPVDDKGRQKREIPVDRIRAVVADSVVLPNEADRKVYIIEDADRMNQQAQNAALKLLEEPPKGVVFLLCAASAEPFLPTVRSRCRIFLCPSAEAERDSETDRKAEEFLRACAAHDEAELFRFCAKSMPTDNMTLSAVLRAASGMTTDMLCRRKDALSMTDRQLYSLGQLLERCLDMLQLNVSPKNVLGLLAVDALEER